MTRRDAPSDISVKDVERALGAAHFLCAASKSEGASVPSLIDVICRVQGGYLPDDSVTTRYEGSTLVVDYQDLDREVRTITFL